MMMTLTRGSVSTFVDGGATRRDVRDDGCNHGVHLHSFDMAIGMMMSLARILIFVGMTRSHEMMLMKRLQRVTGARKILF